MKVDNNNGFVSQKGNWIKIGEEERLDISKKTGPKRLFWKIFGGVVDFVNKNGSAITLRKCDVRRVLGSKFNFDDLQNLINKKATPSSPSEVKPEQLIEPPKAPPQDREPKNYMERKAVLARNDTQDLINNQATPSSPSEVKPEQPIEPPKAPPQYREPKNYMERMAVLVRKDTQRPEAYKNAYNGLRDKIKHQMASMVKVANSEAETQEATFARMALAEHYIALKDATVEQLDQAELWARKAASTTNPYAQALLGVLMNSTKLIGS